MAFDGQNFLWKFCLDTARWGGGKKKKGSGENEFLPPPPAASAGRRSSHFASRNTPQGTKII